VHLLRASRRRDDRRAFPPNSEGHDSASSHGQYGVTVPFRFYKLPDTSPPVIYLLWEVGDELAVGGANPLRLPIPRTWLSPTPSFLLPAAEWCARSRGRAPAAAAADCWSDRRGQRGRAAVAPEKKKLAREAPLRGGTLPPVSQVQYFLCLLVALVASIVAALAVRVERRWCPVPGFRPAADCRRGKARAAETPRARRAGDVEEGAVTNHRAGSIRSRTLRRSKEGVVDVTRDPCERSSRSRDQLNS
jgi:hypothetical protein